MSSIEPTEPAAAPARLNRVRVALWGAVALAAGAGAFALLDKPKPQPGNAEAYASAIGGPFAMIDQNGRPVTDKTLRGRPFAIFFGFTRCPDVCPTTLSRMAQLRKELGSAGDKFDIVFVSVDPEHDKAADIGTYLTLFETPIIGLSGNAAQLAQIVKAYHVYYEKVPQPGGDYTIDHSASVFLMGRKGEFVTTIDGHEGQAPALAKLRRLIDG